MRSDWKCSRLQKQTTAYFSVPELIRGLKAYAVKIDEPFSAGKLFLKRHLNGLSHKLWVITYLLKYWKILIDTFPQYKLCI